MKLPYNLKRNPQAFRASLYITLFAIFLDILFFNFISPTNSEYNNQTIFLMVVYFTLLFFIIRITLDIYINIYVREGVLKLLGELNPDVVNEVSNGENLEKITNELILKAKERRSEINVLKLQENYRKEFLGNVSHELKTPLFTIQGYILTLIEGAMKDKNVRDKYLRRTAKGVDRIISIVKDLDLITQFESGIKTIDRSNFNFFELVDTVFDLLEFESEKNNINLQFEVDYENPIYVNADRERILQVLTNLVVNSVKYSNEKGFTKVIVENYNKEKVIVRVIDNGEGIEEEHLPRLFERFYRIDKTRSRKKGGSGLGLSIVKHIIEAHQEQIFVKSELGKGSEFSFTLNKSLDSNN